jgi:thiol-disulfide isomerase/thioredoxin
MLINKKNTKILIILFCFSIFSSISQTNESVPFNNIAVNETPKSISQVIFEDFLGNKINLKDYYGKLIIINFWATWCAPCKEEMPGLDNLYQNKKFKSLKIFAVNMEQPNPAKTKIFFDKKLSFVKLFKLRGVPTTVLINKKEKSLQELLV